jgi:hypothetical protein
LPTIGLEFIREAEPMTQTLRVKTEDEGTDPNGDAGSPDRISEVTLVLSALQ